MRTYMEERTALFIDGANLYAAARGLNINIDYKRMLDYFSKRGRLIRAFYYTALIEDQDYSPIRPLVDWLDYNGFTMVTKPAREFTDAMGRRKVKGNMDIELAVDAMEMADHLEHIVLFSGDGDFRRLVEALQRRGVRVHRCQHDEKPAAHGVRRPAPTGRFLHGFARSGAVHHAQ